MRTALRLIPLAAFALPGLALAAPWQDATDATIGKTSEWSNKVELADIDGDGRVDILFANGAGYNHPEGPEQSRVFLNQGAGVKFKEVSQQVLPQKGQTRVIKARDVNADGHVDLVVGNSYGGQTWLYLGDGQGGFTDRTDQLPQKPSGIGDLEIGDVDADGDLDIVLADWGPGDAGGEGGVTQLWLGDGAGAFTDATARNMPAIKVSWSWELELGDVDNDRDLDVLVSCKSCPGSYLFHNDGAGLFTDASDQLPQFGNNYDFEAIDLDGDDFLDLVTINDGPQGTEHVFLGDGLGGFEDATDLLWPAAANPPSDDNMAAYVDFDSNGAADIVISCLFGGDDRLLLNDGAGHLTLDDAAFMPSNSTGSLGVAVADLDGDHKFDVVFAEGESNQDADRVFLGVDIPVDTAAPRISLVDIHSAGATFSVHARVHDNKTPVMPHDFVEVVVELDEGAAKLPLTWYGEALWRGLDLDPGAATTARVCATDAAGNTACSDPVAVGGDDPGTTGDEASDTGPDGGTGDTATTGDGTGDAATTGATPTESGPSSASDGATDDTTGDEADTVDTVDIDDDSGCGCRNTRDSRGAWLLALGGLLLARRRRR